jgi:hypothetical protein
MRRLPRILFRAATSLSLLFCLASVALWVRSYHAAERFDVFRRPAPPPTGWRALFVTEKYDDALTVGSWGGRVSLHLAEVKARGPRYYRSAETDSLGASDSVYDEADRRAVDRDIHFRGTTARPSLCEFGAAFDDRYVGSLLFGPRVLFVPWWLPAAVCAILPAYVYVARRRMRRKIQAPLASRYPIT